MRRAFGILFAVTLVVSMAGSVFADELMERTEEKEAQSSMMPGMQGMMGGSGMMNMPMMQNTMGGQGMMGGYGMMNMPMMQNMMGGQGMMGSGMMCPMCGRMMQGMMGGSGMMNMPMMQNMMGGGMMQGMMGAKPHIEGMAAALDLSEEQQTELKDLHTAYKKDMITKRADREIAEIDLQELIEQDDLDLGAVEGKLREIANLEAQTRYAWVKLLVNSKSLLTEKQSMKFKKLMKGKGGSMMMGEKKTDKPRSGERAEHHK